MYIQLLALWLAAQSFADFPGRSASQPATSTNILLQTTDGGQHWLDLSSQLPANVKPVSFWVGAGEYLLGASKGLYRSSATAVVPLWEEEFYQGNTVTGIFPGSTGPYVLSHWNGFYKSLPGTGLWMPLHLNLDDKTVNTLLETRSGALIVGCESGIFKSENKGKTWVQVANWAQVTDIVESNGVLIAACVRGILRSTDGGAHWTWALADRGRAFNLRRTRDGLVAILEGDRRLNRQNANQPYYSTDNGANWQRLGDALPAALFDMHALEQAGDDLFACSSAGIFRSSNHGKAWTRVRGAAGSGKKGAFYKLFVSNRILFVLIQETGGC